MMVILASQSPRRAELLKQIDVQFDVHPADIDETLHSGEEPPQYVQRLAIEKAQSVASLYPGIVLGSDTTVVLDNRVLGKPIDFDHYRGMLNALSGQVHHVVTAVAVTDGVKTLSKVVTTEVEFIELSPDQIERYWHTGEPSDKAGGYGIQGLGAVFVKRISGSCSSVVGLPLAESADLLVQFDIPVWQSIATQ